MFAICLCRSYKEGWGNRNIPEASRNLHTNSYNGTLEPLQPKDHYEKKQLNIIHRSSFKKYKFAPKKIIIILKSPFKLLPNTLKSPAKPTDAYKSVFDSTRPAFNYMPIISFQNLFI